MGYRDKVRPRKMYGLKNRFAVTGIHAYTKPTVVLSGTCSPACLESEVKTGGETIILTLTHGEWNKNTTAFEAARQAMINGLDSAQAESAGWDAEVKGNLGVAFVVRTSDSVVTITTEAEASYATTVTEVITVTIPAALMEAQIEDLVAGTFSVTTGS